MEEHSLTNEQILAFSTALFQAERSQATMEKYLRSVRAFFLYQKDRPVTKDNVMAWKRYLQREENYSPSIVNALCSLNYLIQLSRLDRLPYTLFEDPATPISGDRAGVGPSRL